MAPSGQCGASTAAGFGVGRGGVTAARISVGPWHRRGAAPAYRGMGHSKGDRSMFRKWLLATAAVLLVGGGIAAATHRYWLPEAQQAFGPTTDPCPTCLQLQPRTGSLVSPQAPAAQSVSRGDLGIDTHLQLAPADTRWKEVVSSYSLNSSGADLEYFVGGSDQRQFDRELQWRQPSAAGERYADLRTNPVKLVSEEPVSTFSIDVDTASYANVRRFLTQGVLPPIDAVRTEELINYFDYKYALPESKEQPFRADVALFDSPWDSGSQILRIGIQGYDIPATTRPPANLVFLVDTSGSMNQPDKLPLVKQSLHLLVDQMGSQDSIAIVAYAGSAGVVLEPTKGSDHRKIEAAIDGFIAGGSTAGAEGIRQAYALAEWAFQKDAINRVILATDGDFNVGITDPAQLEDFVARKRESGVYLYVLGYGAGNLNDLMMQKLSQAGNGNAAYIDSLMEARKVLVEEMGATLRS